ncbi:hypothetical protein M7I_7340 [Glarea lozoyensis 74030]|uniref:Uncharacterized protein n=1 Tax=Glarea lozoyensis (strain ATCC 74030 / MF5533) TaxID=1104152 RepID=H0EX15_GLAL7|nr:hypothetical protein M7I_7340 [Glarea lozoyensis 74030]
MALEVYKRENRTFAINTPDFRQNLRNLSIFELDQIRCIRFLWSATHQETDVNQPVKGDKITLLNNERNDLEMGCTEVGMVESEG